MPRKFRLGKTRKNEFRKKRAAEKLKGLEQLEESIEQVENSSEQVENSSEQVEEQLDAPTIAGLQSEISHASIFPKGMYLMMLFYFVSLLF